MGKKKYRFDRWKTEIELLLCCTRTLMDSENVERAKVLLQQSIDWEYLIQTASEHGTIPLLYKNLSSLHSEIIPDTILHQLRQQFQLNAWHNMFLAGELLKILRRFDAHDIRAVPFKGPTLAELVYGDLPLRQFVDLDILIAPRDVPKAKNILTKWGYEPQFHLTEVQEAMYLKSGAWCEYKFWRSDGIFSLELHWRVTPRYFPLAPISDVFWHERLWERMQPVSFANTTVLTLPPEELLFLLCVHGCKHCWTYLSWICDVSEWIRIHQHVDWRDTLKRAKQLGSERMLFIGLFLAHNLLGAKLPREILQSMNAEPVAKALAEQAQGWLFRDSDKPLGAIETLLFRLTARESQRDRIRYCFFLSVVPTFKDYMILRLPAFLSYLYYLLRLIRLIGKCALYPFYPLLRLFKGGGD